MFTISTSIASVATAWAGECWLNSILLLAMFFVIFWLNFCFWTWDQIFFRDWLIAPRAVGLAWWKSRSLLSLVDFVAILSWKLVLICFFLCETLNHSPEFYSMSNNSLLVKMLSVGLALKVKCLMLRLLIWYNRH